MRVDMNISEDIKEPYAVIHTAELTPEIAELVREISQFQSDRPVLIGNLDERMVVIDPEKIVLIRVENDKVHIVTEEAAYRIGKRMYELLEVLGKDFMQVSKSAAVNLKYLESVEPSFNGVMLLHMKNGEKEYISRKFVPQLKKYLGL